MVASIALSLYIYELSPMLLGWLSFVGVLNRGTPSGACRNIHNYFLELICIYTSNIQKMNKNEK